MGKSDPVFRTAPHIGSTNASVDSNKVLGSTSVVFPDIDILLFPFVTNLM